MTTGAGARPDWDDYFLAGARWVAGRATCPKRAVGALLVKEHRLVAAGYNGAPPGQPQCDEVGCLVRDGNCIRAVHAEENALLHAAVRGDLVGATAYIHNGTPCYRCARALLSVGVTRVVCRGSYDDPAALALLTDGGGVVVRRYA